MDAYPRLADWDKLLRFDSWPYNVDLASRLRRGFVLDIRSPQCRSWDP